MDPRDARLAVTRVLQRLEATDLVEMEGFSAEALDVARDDMRSTLSILQILARHDLTFDTAESEFNRIRREFETVWLLEACNNAFYALQVSALRLYFCARKGEPLEEIERLLREIAIAVQLVHPQVPLLIEALNLLINDQRWEDLVAPVASGILRNNYGMNLALPTNSSGLLKRFRRIQI